MLITSLIINSCDTTDPGKETGLTVSSEDVSCTEVWLRLQSDGGVSNPVTITANDKEVKEVILVSSDTVIYIDSLLPGQQYKLKALAKEASSNEAAVKTLDTTSHDITWETYQFGSHGSSLYDVAIINSNDIWAVGEIYMNDETDMYNAVHWDGEKWELKRILIRSFGDLKGYYKLNSVYAFSSEDVWFASNADLIQWNGSSFLSKAFFMETAPFDGQVNQIWGTDCKNIYCAGNGGALYHYTGQSWKKIETGTQLNLYDIWGNETEILAVGSVVGTSQGRIIVQINDQEAAQISTEGISNNIKSIWFISNKAYYAVTADLYYKHNLSDPEWEKCQGVTNYAITSVFGNDRNDVFISASYGDIKHYNGITWYSYYSQTNLSSGVYSKITSKGNISAAVGYNGNNAVLTIGRRQ